MSGFKRLHDVRGKVYFIESAWKNVRKMMKNIGCRLGMDEWEIIERMEAATKEARNFAIEMTEEARLEEVDDEG